MINFLKLPTTWKWRIQKAELSISDVADKMDMKFSNLSALINSRRIPSVNNMQAIETLLAEHGQPFKAEYIDGE